MALAYIDYEQEEFFIAGVRSADKAMLKAYASGDAYIGFGIESGLIPRRGTKATHPRERRGQNYNTGSSLWDEVPNLGRPARCVSPTRRRSFGRTSPNVPQMLCMVG